MRKIKRISVFALLILALLFAFSTVLASDETTTDLSYCEVKYYEDVTDYRNNPEEIEGYLFAGWFTDASCEPSTALTDTGDSVGAYAKYVPKDILGLKVQITGKLWDDDTTNDSNGALRFVTSVDTLDYSEVGFIINIGTKDNYKAGKYVYKQLYGEIGEDSHTKVETYVPSQEFHKNSTYFKTYTVQNISDLKYLTEFHVTPYWITLDGTTVKGDMRTVTVNQLRRWDYVFVDDSGEATVTSEDDSTSVNPGVGTRNYPFKTLEAALTAMKTNLAYQSEYGVAIVSDVEADGTVYILDSLTADSEFAWNTHELDVIVRGDKETSSFKLSAIDALNIGDNVIFENMALTFPAKVFAWGNSLKVAKSVTVGNAANTVSIYGGGNGDDSDDTDDDSVANTSVTLLTGTYKAIVGGGYYADVTGNTELYIAGDTKVYNGTAVGGDDTYVIYGGGYYGNVGGNTTVYVGGDVNADLEYDRADHDRYSTVCGGCFDAVVTGNTSVTVEGNALFTYIYGGGSGGNSEVNGTSSVYFRGSAKSMSIYGGSRLGKNYDDTLVEMSGDTTVYQVFGGCDKKKMTGNTNVRILDGTVKRRVYGGCYNEVSSDGTWTNKGGVTGNTNVTIGADAELVFDYTESYLLTDVKVDNSLYAISRYQEPYSGEVGTFLFTGYTDDSELEDKIGYVDGLGIFGMSYKDYFSDIAYHYLVKAYEGGNVSIDGYMLYIEPDEKMAATVIIDDEEEVHYTTADSAYILPTITSTTEQHKVEIVFEAISDDKDVSGYAVEVKDDATEGKAYYTSLETAVNCVVTTDAKTITLLKDAVISSTLTIDEGETITIIDDGSKTVRNIVRSTTAFAPTAAGVLFKVADNASLTFSSTGTDELPLVVVDGSKDSYENDEENISANWAMVQSTGDKSVVNINAGVEFTNNGSGATGGVIKMSKGTLTVSGGTFSDNIAYDKKGGVMIIDANCKQATIENATFTGNEGKQGGAILIANGGQVTITGCTFSDNNATTSGGAIENENQTEGNVTISNCTFKGNEAPKGGALGIVNKTGAHIVLENCTFAGNTATSEYATDIPQGNDICIGKEETEVHLSGKIEAEIFNAVATKLYVDGALEYGSDVKVEWCVTDSEDKTPAADDNGNKIGIVFADDTVMNASKPYISLGEMAFSKYSLAYISAVGRLVEPIEVASYSDLTTALTTIEEDTADKIGVIRLTGDISLSSQITIPENSNVTIEDDGYQDGRKIIRGKKHQDMILMQTGATLTLRSTGAVDDWKLILDGNEENYPVTDTSKRSAIMRLQSTISDADINIYRGVKLQNNATGKGSAAILNEASNSTVYVNEACIQGMSSANHGGAIFVGSNVTCNIINTKFDDCEGKLGGAIYSKGTLSLFGTSENAVISNCYCSSANSAIYLDGGTLEGSGYTFTKYDDNNVLVKVNAGTNNYDDSN